MTKNKAELRKEIKQILHQNDYGFGKWSDIICKKIINSQEFTEADTVLAYMALPDEPDLSPAINRAFLENKKVYIPRIIPDTSKMDFYSFIPYKTKPGSFGIMEPEEKHKFEQKNNQNIVILVPGRAFTKGGKRMGRGKGFYDIFLTNLLNKKGDFTNCKITLLGICFSCQLLEDLPTEAHDITMNRIISEE